MKRIPDTTKTQILDLRSKGLTYAKIAKKTKVSQSSVIKIIKEGFYNDQPIEAKVKKPCPNPRIIIIYFDDELENDAKCVVRPNINLPIGKSIQVKKVETSEEPLYRLA